MLHELINMRKLVLEAWTMLCSQPVYLIYAILSAQLQTVLVSLLTAVFKIVVASRIFVDGAWPTSEPHPGLPTGSPQVGPQHSRMPQQALRALVPMNMSPKNSRTSCKIYIS